MQEVAKKVGFNETAFPLKSDKADLRIRYFTPGHEINLCGHATMATIYALTTKGLLGDKTSKSTFNLLIEQGQEIGRDGRIGVTVTNGDTIEVTDNAVYVKEFEVYPCNHLIEELNEREISSLHILE